MPTNINRTPARKSKASRYKKKPNQDDGLVSGSVLRNGGAQIRMMKDSCRIHHREMVGFVQATTSGSGPPNLQWFSMNPASLPWLKVQSRGWEQYRYHDIRIHYEPSCAATASGLVALFPDMDDEDNDPTTITQVMAMNGACNGPVYRRSTSVVSPTALKIAPTRYVTEADEPTPDSRWTNVGWFGVWSEGCTVSAPGQIVIEYDVTLFIQQSPRGVEPSARNTGLLGPVINAVSGKNLKKIVALGNNILEATNPTTDTGVTTDPKGFRVAGARFGWATAMEWLTAGGLSVAPTLLMYLQKYTTSQRVKLSDLESTYQRPTLGGGLSLEYAETTIETSSLAFDMQNISETSSVNSSDPWKHCGLVFTVGRAGESDLPSDRVLSIKFERKGVPSVASDYWAIGANQYSEDSLTSTAWLDNGNVLHCENLDTVDYTVPLGTSKIMKMVVQRVVTTSAAEGYTIDFYLGRDWSLVNGDVGWRIACFALGSSSTLDSQIEFSINAFSSSFDELRTRMQLVRHKRVDNRKVRSPKKLVN